MADDLEKDRKDWVVFLRLSRIARAGGQLSKKATNELARIQKAHPDWQPGDGDRDDFAVWFSVSSGEAGDAAALADVHTEDVLDEARTLADADRLNNSSLWRRFVAAEPNRSLKALADAAEKGDWRTDEWGDFFSHIFSKDDRPLMLATIDFLEAHEIARLSDALDPLIQWLRHQYIRLIEHLDGPDRLLAIWDRLAATVPLQSRVSPEELDDPMFSALNERAGVLSLVLVEELIRRKLPAAQQFPDDLQARFDTILTWRGRAGLVGQMPLFERLAYLDQQASDWTLQKLAPLLNPKSVGAGTRWIARFHSGYAGSAQLFNATADGFWWSFDLKQEEESWREGQVVMLMQAALRKLKGEDYEITPQQSKDALLRAGPSALKDCARHLVFGDSDPDERAKNWRELAKPVFQFVWPGDQDARTGEATENLVRVAMAAEAEFPDAVATFAPFLTAAWETDWSFFIDYERKGRELFAQFPEAAVALLDVLIPPDRGPASLNEMLDDIEAAQAQISADFRFQRLRSLAKRLAA